MKTVDPDLLNHLGQDVTTMTSCWKLTLTDGTVKAFTALDVDLTVEGVVYKSTSGFSSSGVPSSTDSSVNSVDIKSFIDDIDITEEDVLSGVYDKAKVEMFKINYKDTTMGKIIQMIGWIGDVSKEGDLFIAEVRGRGQNLKQKLGELYSPTCRALLGDARCTVDMQNFKTLATVASVTSDLVFTVDSLGGQVADYFKRGKVTFTSGDNNGRSFEIRTNADGITLELMFSPTYTIAVNDTIEVYPGCAKTLAECRDRYSNVVNFRGEPLIPTISSVVAPLGV